MSEVQNAIVAVYADHGAADAAIRKIAEAGLDMRQFSIVGRTDHAIDRSVSLRRAGERIRFWAGCGALWGGVGGLLLGGLMITIPEVGIVLVFGHMTMVVVAAVSAAIDGATVLGGLGALGAALASLGILHHDHLLFGEALKAGGVLVLGHGTSAEVEWARVLLQHAGPEQITIHVSDRLVAPAPPR